MNMARKHVLQNDRTRSMREAVRKPMQTCGCGSEDILAEFPSYGYRRITTRAPETRPAGQSQASLTCHAGARTHAPPGTRMARHDEQQAQAARLSEPEMFDHSGGA